MLAAGGGWCTDRVSRSQTFIEGEGLKRALIQREQDEVRQHSLLLLHGMLDPPSRTCRKLIVTINGLGFLNPKP